MEWYLGARENTDALTFKKAASHSRQNHATPLPLYKAHIPERLQYCYCRLGSHKHTEKSPSVSWKIIQIVVVCLSKLQLS